MPVLARRPRPALAPFVESLWLYQGEHAHALERVLPTPFVQLLVNLDGDALRSFCGPAFGREERIGGAGLVGLRDGAAAIETAQQRRMAGVVFRPTGASMFFDVPLHELRNSMVDLGDLWGRGGAALRERLLEAPDDDSLLTRLEDALLAQMRDARDRKTEVAADSLLRGGRVGPTAERLGWSVATLRRRFLARVGNTPKRFARVARLGRAVAALQAGPPRSWASFALDHGYVDQSHWIRELRDLAGVTPTAYAPRAPGEPNHVVIDSSNPLRPESGSVQP